MVKIGAGHRETGHITCARQKQRGAKVAKLPRAPTRALFQDELAETLTRSSRHRIHAITTFSLRHPSTFSSQRYALSVLVILRPVVTLVPIHSPTSPPPTTSPEPAAATPRLPRRNPPRTSRAGQDAPASSPEHQQHRPFAIITIASSTAPPNSSPTATIAYTPHSASRYRHLTCDV
jgi:hypothetical protein